MDKMERRTLFAFLFAVPARWGQAVGREEIRVKAWHRSITNLALGVGRGLTNDPYHHN